MREMPRIFPASVLFLSLLLPLAAQIPQPGSEGRAKLPWLSSYTEALKRAERDKKPILLDVTTDWCSWSKKMERETFADKEVQKEMSDFLLVRLNAEEEANESVVKEFKVSSYPTLLVLNYKGEVVGQAEGFLDVKDMKVFCQKYKSVFKGNPLGYKEVQLPPEDPLFAALEKARKLSDKAREQGYAQVLDYYECKIQADGRDRALIRSTYWVLDDEAFGLPEPERVYDSARFKITLKSVRILNERGQGREVDTRLAKIENVYSEESIYWDVKRISLDIPAVKKGQILDIIEEWERQPIMPGEYFMRWNTGLKVLVDSDIILTFPKNFPLKYKAQRCPTPVEEKILPDGWVQWRLKTSNLEPAEVEPYISPLDLWEGVIFHTRLTPDDLAKWYTGLCKGRDQLPPEAKTRLREILAKHQGAEERLQAIMDWVTKDIRYVSLAFKDSTHQPHPVKDTLGRKYGDCKDQSLLVMALCREAGFQAHLVLLGQEFGEEPDPETLAVEKFDHCIVQVKTKEKIYYLDPAAGPRKVGQIVKQYASHPALVIEGNKGSIVTLPPYDTQANKEHTHAIFEITPEGGGVIIEKMRREGEAARRSKEEIKDTGVDKVRRVLEERFKSAGGKVLEFTMTKPTDEGDVFESYLKVRLPRVGMKLADGLMLQLGTTPAINPEIIGEERQYPFRFHATDPLRRTFEIILPEGAKLADPPESIEINEPFLKAFRKFKVEDNKITLEEHFEFLTARLPASDKDKVRETFRRWHENRTMAHRISLPKK
ncbi:thioredoxin family protein [Fontisphaera persica]|uniref:thioredoxin family protein n=1 Tax=Fontisphaera persica TaxID=2974023 RepID=UPI0024C0A4F6|nr:thioredoxin family protein [Fontisphaera persica]WCJ58245.1 thioredoxin family protein [Fontisphaera persica]